MEEYISLNVDEEYQEEYRNENIVMIERAFFSLYLKLYNQPYSFYTYQTIMRTSEEYF